MDNVITPATEADIPQLANVLTEAGEFKVDQGDTVWGNKPYSKEDISEMLNSGEVLVARMNGRAIGSLLLQWEDPKVWGELPPDAGYIHRLAVGKESHGMNVGGLLMKRAAEEASKNSRSFLRLDCPADNKRLREYYEQQGFKLVAVKPNPYYKNESLTSYYERHI